jgi:hypothetical protein
MSDHCTPQIKLLVANLRICSRLGRWMNFVREFSGDVDFGMSGSP